MGKRSRRTRIPGAEEWRGDDADREVRHARKLLFGRSIADVQQYFGGVPLACDLARSPPRLGRWPDVAPG